MIKTSARLCACALLFLATPGAWGQQYSWSTFAGLAGGPGNVDGVSGAARFNGLGSAAVDASGNIYVADTANHTIRKVTSGGAVSLFAGVAGTSGAASTSVSGVATASATFNSPSGVAVDSAGNVYVADTGNQVIRKISGGQVYVFAGKAGTAGSANGAAGTGSFNGPTGIALDANGNLYVADTGNGIVRKVISTGEVFSFAGTAFHSGNVDGTGTAAQFSSPAGIAVDAGGLIYVTDTINNNIRQITSAAVVSTLVSSGLSGARGLCASGGKLYVADTLHDTVRVVSGGVLSALAGSSGSTGISDGSGTTARFNVPQGIAADAAGSLYVADTGNDTLRKVTAAGAVSTLAGTPPFPGTTDGTGTGARFNGPGGVVVDANWNVYVADTLNHTIRKITSTGTVSTFAGSPGVSGSTNGTGTGALFFNPHGLALDASGNLYVADTSNHAIRKITSAGVVTTLAGSVGVAGTTNGTGTAAKFNHPHGIAVDSTGNLYVTDTDNYTIRKVTAAGVVTTFAGLAGTSGAFDAAAGTSSSFVQPMGITIDASGNLYVADGGGNIIRKIAPTSAVTTIAGSAVLAGSTDSTGTASRFNNPYGISADASGNLFVADTYNHTMRQIVISGAVASTVGGKALAIGGADGINASAQFAYPYACAVSSTGTVYVVDANNRVIKGLPVSTLYATFSSAQTVPLTTAGLAPGASTVTLVLNYVPATGTTLTMVKNTGKGFIQGTYTNLAQGQVVSLPYNGITYKFVANYYGGASGRDLVLQWANVQPVAWGLNSNGEVGDGTTGNAKLPVTVEPGALAGKTVLSVVAGGAHSLALCSDGSLAGWGANNVGQIGYSATTPSYVPVAISAAGALQGKTVVAIAGGDSHSVALCSDGTVACWGYNSVGQLGNGNLTNSYVPVPVTGILSNKVVVAIAAGAYHTLALCSDGTLAGWGLNSSGELGNSLNTSSSVPVPVTLTGVLSGKTITAIAAGSYHSMALCSTGAIAIWGDNAEGELGNGTTVGGSLAPVLVTATGVLSGKVPSAIAAYGLGCIAICTDGTVATWGDNSSGQLGNNSMATATISRTAVLPVATSGVLKGRTPVQPAGGSLNCMALCSDGTLAAWGDNTYGQVGDYSNTLRQAPVAVSTLSLTTPGELFMQVSSSQDARHAVGLVALPSVATIDVQQPSATSLASGLSAVDFGSAAVGSPLAKTFALKNTGLAPLIISHISFDGANAADFSVGSFTSPLTPGTATTVNISFNPGASGSRSANMHVVSNDSVNGDFVVFLTGTGAPPPVMGVSSGGSAIADGGSQDFGSVVKGGSQGVTFTIGNSGPASLTGLTYAIDGTDQMMFSVTTAPVAPVANGGTTTFTVAFSPTSTGSKTAAIHILSNDAAHSPYDITLTGTGLAPPAIVVSGSSPLNNGVAIDLGPFVLGASEIFGFGISNSGGSTLTGLTITIDGPDASMFSVTSPPSAPLAAGGSTTLSLQFRPTSAGAKSAAVHIASNDPATPSFTINLTGTVQSPVISVNVGGAAVANGGSSGFGSVVTGGTLLVTFNVANSGSASLTSVIPTVSGPDASMFNVITSPALPVAPGSTANFTVQFVPTSTGARSAVLSIASNDLARSPYLINLAGTGLAPPRPAVSVSVGGSALVSGNAVPFSPVVPGPGNTSTVTFTVTNSGAANLTVLTPTTDGKDATMFTLFSAPVLPLTPGASTTFTMQFAPASTGAKTAALHLASDDPASPFTVTLSGTGATATPPIATTGTATQISLGGAVLNGTINARGSDRTVTFDYGLTTAYGSSVAVNQGTISSSLTMPVTATLSALQPHTRYYYRIDATGPLGAATGAAASFVTLNTPPAAFNDAFVALPSAKVVIDVLANDTDADGDALTVYSFTQPGTAVGTVARTGSTLTFTPSASFSGGVFTYAAADAFGGHSSAALVSLSLDGSFSCPGSLSAASDQATAMLSPIVAAAPFTATGAPSWLTFNPIVAGDSQVTFKFTPNPALASRWATVKVGGKPVVITQAGVSAVPVLSVPLTVPDAAISAAYNLAIPTQNGPVTYTATGLPAGLVLSNATGHITGMPTVAKTYNVSIFAKNVKGVSNTIAFAINVQAFPVSLIGGWSATVQPDLVVNGSLGGLLSFTVAANGPVTGTLKNGAASYTFTGRLNTAVDPASPAPLHPRLTVTIPKTTLVVSVDLNSGVSQYLTGTVTTASASATVAGAQQVWALASHALASDYASPFTIALEPTVTDARVPEGDGFLTFNVSTKGVVTWGGQLADGTVFAVGTTTLWPAGEVPVFASLYVGKGSVLGVPAITPITRAVTGSLAWVKNVQPATARAYAAGFEELNPVPLHAVGAAYVAPPRYVSVVAGGQTGFSGAGIENVAMAASLSQSFTVGITNLATLPTVAAGNVANVRITAISAATGTFTGSFTLKDPSPYSAAVPPVLLARTVTFSGIFLSGTNSEGTGYFLLPAIENPAANVKYVPETSGLVNLAP